MEINAGDPIPHPRTCPICWGKGTRHKGRSSIKCWLCDGAGRIALVILERWLADGSRQEEDEW